MKLPCPTNIVVPPALPSPAVPDSQPPENSVMRIFGVVGLRNLGALLAAGLFAMTLGSGDAVAAEPPATGGAAEVGFSRITYSDSGGFTGAGTGKWLSIDGSGKLQLKKRKGPAVDGQLDKQQLADLAKDVAAVDWSNVKTLYPSRGADMIQNDLVVTIDGKTHGVHAVARAAEIPPAVKALFARLANLYQHFATAEK